MSTDLWPRIKTAVVTTIAALNLGGIEARVKGLIDVALDPNNLEYPCIVAVTAGLMEETVAGDTLYRHTWYPIGLMLLYKGNLKQEELEPVILGARKGIFDAFHDKRLAGVAEVQACQVQPKMAFDPRLPQYELVRSSLLLRFLAREARS